MTVACQMLSCLGRKGLLQPARTSQSDILNIKVTPD